MTEHQLPDHIAVFVAAIKDNPALTAGATEAVGDRTGTDAANAAAEYYQSQGYTITAEELLALKAASKSALGEELHEDELASIAGGWVHPNPHVFRDPWPNQGAMLR